MCFTIHIRSICIPVSPATTGCARTRILATLVAGPRDSIAGNPTTPQPQRIMIMRIAIALFLFALQSASPAAENAPWGRAGVTEQEYSPQKVVYDVAVSSRSALENVLDRASYLSTIYNADPFAASIVLVLHGDEIPYFAISAFKENEELMRRAQSLTVGGVISIRMCRIAARGHGFEPGDIHGFVEMVPMADAELVRLQQEEGYVYMR